MIRFRNCASCLFIGAAVLTPLTVTTVAAGDDARDQFDNRSAADDISVNRIADHCAQFGQGFVDVGNGVCGRVRTHVRVYVGSRNAPVDAVANALPTNNVSTTNNISPTNNSWTTGNSLTISKSWAVRKSWTTNGTSSAALRSEGMVPGVEVTHLRVRGSLDSFDPFH